MRKRINYEELEGKEVTFIVPPRGTRVEAIVTGIEPAIGITVQEKGTNAYLFCVNGPLSPVTKRVNSANPTKANKLQEKLFVLVRDMIIDGTVDGRHIRKHMEDNDVPFGIFPSSRHCAFSQ